MEHILTNTIGHWLKIRPRTNERHYSQRDIQFAPKGDNCISVFLYNFSGLFFILMLWLTLRACKKIEKNITL